MSKADRYIEWVCDRNAKLLKARAAVKDCMIDIAEARGKGYMDDSEVMLDLKLRLNSLKNNEAKIAATQPSI